MIRAAIALVSLSTLCLQVALVRVLSVSLWYHFAFLVVSTAVLGYGLSGMALGLWPRLLKGDVRRRLAVLAASFAVSVAVCFVLLNALDFDPFDIVGSKVQLLVGAVYILLCTIPFFLSGLVVGIILVHEAAAASRLYAFDLMGAGVGCVVVVFAFGPLGGSGTVFLAAALAAMAALVLAWPFGVRARVAGVLLLLGFGGLAVVGERVVPVRISDNKPAGGEVLSGGETHLFSEWNAISRVDVVQTRRGPVIFIDGGVAMVRFPFVRDRPGRLPPSRDITALAFHLVDEPSVLVIGSGAGWEVFGALTHQARSIDAVEVNPIINRLVTGPFAGRVGHIFEHPAVNLVTDEARSYLRRADRRWDVIVSAHTISNAAMSTGAMSLAESYTLTREAFEDYLDHLSDDGVLYFTRPRSQLSRLAGIAAAVLEADGLEPHRHLALVGLPPERPHASFTGGFLMSRRPLEGSLRDRLERAVEKSGLVMLPLQIEAGAGATVTDDRPFFHLRRPFGELTADDFRRVFGAGEDAREALEDAPVVEVSLLVLLGEAVVLAALFTFVPLLATRRRARVSGRVVAYFALLGAAFMLVELGLVHRLTLFIGPPTLAFTTVLGALLASSGLGSYLSTHLDPQRHLPRVLLSCAAILAVFGLLAPFVTDAALGLPIAVRVALTVLIIAPVGVAMGMPFPLGLRHAHAHSPDSLPLCWGVNGFTSVIASVMSIMLATVSGFSSVLLAGAVTYLLAFAVWYRSAAQSGATGRPIS